MTIFSRPPGDRKMLCSDLPVHPKFLRDATGSLHGTPLRISLGRSLEMTGAFSSLLLLNSPLGDDRQPYQSGMLHAIAMTARERISAPYEIEVDAVSTERAIKPDRLLYRPVGLTVRRKDGTDRHFHGIVRRFTARGIERRGRWVYRLEIVPRLWFLTQSVDCRIFQHKSAKDILSEIFRQHEVIDFEFRLFGSDDVRPYTTQYDETDLQFAHRIMQESGLYYFFEFSESSHKLVVANRNQTFRHQDGPLHRVIGQGDNVDVIDAWSEGLTTTTGAVLIQDYDPEKPRRPVDGQHRTRFETAGAAKRRVYRWPAMTVDRDVADRRAQYRQEAAEAAAAMCCGHGFDPRMSAGLRFTLETDPISREAQVDFVVQSVTHRAIDETWLGGSAPPTFDCEFTCFRHAVTWRDDLTIPRPAMTGIFSGIVLGEAGKRSMPTVWRASRCSRCSTIAGRRPPRGRSSSGCSMPGPAIAGAGSTYRASAPRSGSPS